jgi:hypothetical protein
MQHRIGGEDGLIDFEEFAEVSRVLLLAGVL